MRIAMLAIVPAFAATLAGCARGQPASLAPASRQSVAPAQTFGFNPAVRQFAGIPVDTAACITETGVNVVRDLVQGARCVLDTLIPIVTPPAPTQAAPQSAPCAPQYAPAPRSTPPCGPACAGATCALPQR